MSRSRSALEDTVGYHDLMADLRRGGCPACHGAQRAAWRYLDSLLWEFVNDAGVRARLRRSHGFCREHASMAISVASKQAAALGMAILFQDLLGHVVEDAAREARERRDPRGRRRTKRTIHPTEACPACEAEERVAANYSAIIAAATEGTPPHQAIRRPGRGLCARHLAAALGSAHDAQEAERLVDAFAVGANELRAELAEFIRKQDYRHQHEGLTDAEATAWTRAVRRLVGEPRPQKQPER